VTREFSEIDPSGNWATLGTGVETAYHQFHAGIHAQGNLMDDLAHGHEVDRLVESLNTLANEHRTAAIVRPTHPSAQRSKFVDPDGGVKWAGDDGTTYRADVFGGFSSPSEVGKVRSWLR
jgi:hypothetical protein